MSLIPAAEVKRSQARSATDAQAVTAEALAAEALIAEARAHARRRRLKIAVALAVLVAVAVTAMLIGRVTIGSHRAAQARPPALAAGTGIVTGHLAACFGIRPASGRPIAPGTVVVLRGHITWKPVAPGTWMIVYPKGPAVASQHIADNYDQTFRFALPPGPYVLAGRYDHGSGYGTFREVTVTAGANLRADLPNLCQ